MAKLIQLVADSSDDERAILCSLKERKGDDDIAVTDDDHQARAVHESPYR